MVGSKPGRCHGSMGLIVTAGAIRRSGSPWPGRRRIPAPGRGCRAGCPAADFGGEPGSPELVQRAFQTIEEGYRSHVNFALHGVAVDIEHVMEDFPAAALSTTLYIT